MKRISLVTPTKTEVLTVLPGNEAAIMHLINALLGVGFKEYIIDGRDTIVHPALQEKYDSMWIANPKLYEEKEVK